ncbi:MAG: PQQ-binding-like beta-propeller repeat protein [bacterium]|nr:PQQ-binding-like beta-propeller repeat protein [bacterium]
MTARPPRSTRILVLLIAVLLAAPAAAADWLQRGGPDGDFKVADAGLADAWPEAGPGVVWSRPLGSGYSGILVEGDRLYTAFRRGDNEVVTALDSATGETIWEHENKASAHEDQTKDFGEGPNATPLIHGDHIYSIGFRGLLQCLDKKTGKAVWSRDLERDLGAKMHEFGYSNSPVARNGMIIVLVGGDEHGAVGFDPQDGKIRWKTPKLAISYSTPVFIEIAGEEQMVFMSPDEIVGVRMTDAAVRWRHEHKNQYSNNCSGPWWGDDGLLFVSSQADAGSRTLRLKKKGDEIAVKQVSREAKYKIFHNSAIRLGKHVYGVGASGILIAYDIEAGKILWRERGYPAANMVWADGKFILLDENGKLSLAGMSPDGLELHASHEILKKPAWTAPTLVGTRLYARDGERIVALELGRESIPKAGAE